MAWALVVALAVVGAWLWYRRARPPRVAPPASDLPQGGARPIRRVTNERGLDRQTLLDAFRSEELPIPEDADRDDRAMLVRMLQLLADYTLAREAVLWEPHESADGHLVATAWSRGAEPPALPEADRLLVELAASEQRTTANATGPFIRLMAMGVSVHLGRGAVSIHFDEAAPLSRADLETRLARVAVEVAARHELLRARATLAVRTKRLRSMIRTATTLQGSRDPVGHEALIVSDACVVTGAEWGVLVRGTREGSPPAIARASERSPTAFAPGLTAGQQTIVGSVFKSGRPRVHADTRPLVGTAEELFDATPVPSGTRSLLVVPVRRSEHEPCLGVLVLGHGTRNAFSHSDAHSALDLGTIAAGALDTAWAWQDATLSAKTDQLTGLPNRRAFEEEFARMIAETDRFGNASALVIVDVDHFKRVNDTYGHEAGDQVLKQVGATLLSMKRTTDRVARLGGEELAILLPQTDREGAMEAAERCRKAIERLVVPTSAGPVQVTASFGVAMYAERSGAAGALFDRADQALYAAKNGGRNRVVLAPD